MPLNLSTIRPAVLKAKEVATQEYVDNTTASALANSGFVLPAEVANAINTNTTTIDGSKITTGTIQAGAIAAGAITADKVSADVFSGQTIIGGNIYGTRIEGASILGAVIKSSWIDYSNTGVLTNWQHFTPATVPSQYVGNFAKNTDGSLVVDSMGYVRLPGSNVVRTEAHSYDSGKVFTTNLSIPTFVTPLRSWDYYYEDTPNRFITNSFVLNGSASITLSHFTFHGDSSVSYSTTFSTDLAFKVGNTLFEVYLYDVGTYDMAGSIKRDGTVVQNVYYNRAGGGSWTYYVYNGISVQVVINYDYSPSLTVNISANNLIPIESYNNVRNLIELVRGTMYGNRGNSLGLTASANVGLFTAQN